ncbi:hypothetical protein B296_00055633, partial [Ensete ventricosum]
MARLREKRRRRKKKENWGKKRENREKKRENEPWRKLFHALSRSRFGVALPRRSRSNRGAGGAGIGEVATREWKRRGGGDDVEV